jgi:hypothetical protein
MLSENPGEKADEHGALISRRGMATGMVLESFDLNQSEFKNTSR